jgi:choline monooxygenase
VCGNNLCAAAAAAGGGLMHHVHFDQVPYAHKDLSSGLDLSGYTNELHEVLSIQSCAVQPADMSGGSTDGSSSSGGSSGGSSDPPEKLDRLGGRDAAYAFVYPNFMVNRYGELPDKHKQ